MRGFTILTTLALFTILILPAQTDPLCLLMGVESLRLSSQTKNIHARRWESVTPQTSEVTCGPAALSTLLNIYFGASTTEDELAQLSGTYEQGSTSLSGLRNACTDKGYEAKGYKLTLKQLKKLLDDRHIPILVHLEKPTLHYVLIIGHIDSYLLVSDPASGSLSIPEEDFIRRWSGKALVVSRGDDMECKTADEQMESAKTRLSGLCKAGRMMSFH